MRVLGLPDGTQVYHDLDGSFAPIASLLLRGRPAVAALGPVYSEDPAAGLLAPFHRTAESCGWHARDALAPEWAWERARTLRREAVAASLELLFERGVADCVDWTRAGLVLAIAGRRGIHVRGHGTLHPRWRLRGTVTGRFGVEPVRGHDWTFSPLSLGPDDRWRIVPHASGRRIAVLDFRAMDLCSMASLVPGLAARYAPFAEDMHLGTALLLNDADEMCGGLAPVDMRDLAKREVFVHAYGGQSELRESLERALPELDWLRRMPHGEGARLVQAQSALAFRAALSRALPLLTGDDVVPLFAVHDELALDYSESHADALAGVAMAMEEGASQRIGSPYHVGVSTGQTYDGAKNA